MTIKREVIAGLDLGSTKICVFVAEVTYSGKMEVIAIGTAPSSGVNRGLVVDLDSVTQAIRTAVKRAEDLAEFKITEVYVGIAGEHILSLNNKVSLEVQGEVTEEHIAQILDKAKSVSLAHDREVINALPISFSLDGCQGIKAPVGMFGHNLELEAHVITGAGAAIANIVKCVNNAGLCIKELVLQPIASAEAVLTQAEKDRGVILIDIGGGTTDIAVFEKGSICHSAILPVGGNHVSSDLSIVLGISAAASEELKIQQGSALSCLIDPREKMEIEGIDEWQEIRRCLLSEIIEARMQEIFHLAVVEIHNAGYQDYLLYNVVVTGGCALLRDLPAMTERLLGVSLRLGFPEDVSGFPFSKGNISPVYSTAVGLARYGLLYGSKEPEAAAAEEIKEEEKPKVWSIIREWLKGFFQDRD